MKAACSRDSANLDPTVPRRVNNGVCRQVVQYLFKPVEISKDHFSARPGGRREGDPFLCAIGIVGRDHIAEQLLHQYVQ